MGVGEHGQIIPQWPPALHMDDRQSDPRHLRTSCLVMTVCSVRLGFMRGRVAVPRGCRAACCLCDPSASSLAV